jgi:hypothetical protein
MDDWEIVVQFWKGQDIFLFCRCLDRVWEPPTFYWMGSGVFPSQSKDTWAWIRPLTLSSVVVKNKWSCTTIYPYALMACNGTALQKTQHSSHITICFVTIKAYSKPCMLLVSFHSKIIKHRKWRPCDVYLPSDTNGLHSHVVIHHNNLHSRQQFPYWTELAWLHR